ncbi:unnamed protein product [Urochloa decumbens]|uniref:Pectinesterase inhibitor domain-containing protein n=1 Tax=Urochloa decumbens TaxID=240449 RepID=A0ABC8WYZ6_9POAL
MAMATISLQLFFLLAGTSAVVATSRSPMAPAQAPEPSSSAISFLRASCAATNDAADFCYNLLLPYADTFNGSLARVARAASAIAEARQHDFTEELARLKLRGTGAGKVADMALTDCSNEVSTSDMFSNETLGHIDNLIAHQGSQKDFDSQKITAVEFMTSAESGLTQCVDWFHSAGEAAVSSPVGKEVIDGCTTLSPYLQISYMLVDAVKF